MNITKAGPFLLERLRNSSADDVLQVIVMLVFDEDGTEAKAPLPSDFPTRVAWREALITHRSVELTKRVGNTLQAMRDLGLTVQGGTLLSCLTYIEGTAKQILLALELPGVKRAELNHTIKLDTLAVT